MEGSIELDLLVTRYLCRLHKVGADADGHRLEIQLTRVNLLSIV